MEYCLDPDCAGQHVPDPEYIQSFVDFIHGCALLVFHFFSLTRRIVELVFSSGCGTGSLEAMTSNELPA
jgi:hypothetical protein